jgi:hypothetical protein
MRAICLVLLLLGAGYAGNALALDVEQLFMPGELISAHDEFKSECTNCHVRLRDTTQKKLCLGCHDHRLVAEDILRKQGFHGKHKEASKLDCKTCHSDHQGVDASIISLDEDNFDHKFTDYELNGKHLTADCNDCHEQGRKHREAKHGCFDCHSEDDAHDGKLGKKCADCHNPEGWNKSKFDHDETEFKLKFLHQQVACNSCHLQGKYKDIPRQCVDCHAIRDIHANRFGDNCNTCHQEKGWDKSLFNHDRDTRYRLDGKHLETTCNDCHAPDYKVSEEGKTPRDCFSCHRADDVHKGKNGKQCQDCHDTREWEFTSFDHDAKTDFPLKGGHEELSCEACHLADAKTRQIDTACYSCHELDDVHKQEQGSECSLCHNEISWQNQVRFDHDISVFPLIGQHAAVVCEACHLTSVFGDTDDRCIDCHQADDVHKQGLGEECEVCHNANAWLIWDFDHDQTEFKLRHRHDELHCDSCHSKPLQEFTEKEWICIDCHRRDDVHRGEFGESCNRCHNEKSFNTITIRY